MSLPYEYYTVNISELVLDAKNPRFASSTLVDRASKVSEQKDIINHLLKHGDVLELAKNICRVNHLHGSEMITCYPDEDGHFIVAEGNRRVCACKLLINRTLIPKEYESIFPVASQETIENIKTVVINLYSNRESVQSYLSDRHISSVKKWSTLEKNNYYMNLFQQYKDIQYVKAHTTDSIAKIKKSIIEYQFFMDVYNVLKTNGIELEIEKIDYLPLADRFMDVLVGHDDKVGLSLELDSSNFVYLCPEAKKEIYNEILLLVGKAFLCRSSTDNPPKIIGSDVANQQQRKNLILEDIKIPGLYELIKKFKDIEDGGNVFPMQPVLSDVQVLTPPNIANNSPVYNPPPSSKFIPKTHKMEYLSFTEQEGALFVFDDTEGDNRIKQIIHELATIKLANDPIACTCLYRCLLESCAKRVFAKVVSKATHEYSENDLLANLVYINNEIIFKGQSGSEVEKTRKVIKDRFGKGGIIDILNLYIHYPKMVDTTVISSSWQTMKIFVIKCLSI